MVKPLDPILLIAVPLGVAFLLPLLARVGRGAARWGHALTVLFTVLVAGQWLLHLWHGGEPAMVITGGWEPPLGINLRLGLPEAVICLLAGLTALATLPHLAAREDEASAGRASLLQLLLLTAAFGLTMTRDLFNLFVFTEIASIGTYALVAFGRERSGLEAGFKYMLIGSVASAFLLIGIAFLYKSTGTLNLDDMAGKLAAGAPALLGTMLLFLLGAFVIELKQVPVNGPAVDLYEGVEPGVMALLVGTTVNAVLYAFWKVSALFPADGWTLPLMTIGMATFVVANLLAIGQQRPRRMLGYSSSAQLGLLLFLVPLLRDGTVAMAAAGLLLVNHGLAKAGLLWLVGGHGGETLEDWRGAFADAPWRRTVLVLSVLAMVGMPPLPGFWGKWDALVGIVRDGRYAWWIAPLLVGSLLEFVYYFRWLRHVQEPSAEQGDEAAGVLSDLGTIVLPLAGLVGLGAWRLVAVVPPAEAPLLWLLAGGAALVLLGRLPRPLPAVLGLVSTVAVAVALAGAGGLAPTTLPGLFGLMILLGALVVQLSTLGLPVPRPAYHGLLVLLVGSVLLLVRAQGLLVLFVAWEMMTWTSYLLVAQGREGAAPGYRYILFAGASGLLTLAGLLLAIGGGAETVGGLATLAGTRAAAAWSLLALGFAVKAAAWGAHIWAPDAYAESPDVFTPFLSGVVSKMPMFALAAVAFRVGHDLFGPGGGQAGWSYALAWLGGLTAFGMTLLAVFQEDAKRLLAYSSVGQVGYIVVGLAVMTPLGWSAAFYHAVNHLLFKGLLFLAVAGVVARTGTRRMSEMGGLIKKMPVSFVSVLIGIIALSGVPPLSGFGGKWLLYQALLARGWFLLLAGMMFASAVAFLYCFRLIHTIFLGQLKERHREVREAPWPQLLAEIVLMVGIMVLSVQPQLLLRPLQAALAPWFAAPGVTFSDGALVVPGGYFHPWHVMLLVMALFVVVLLLLVVLGPRPRKVGQLDIVYSGELPPPPEEIHYAHDFYRPYARAFGPVLGTAFMRFWEGLAGTVTAVVGVARRFYSGNGQTYVLYSLAVVVVCALLGVGR